MKSIILITAAVSLMVTPALAGKVHRQYVDTRSGALMRAPQSRPGSGFYNGHGPVQYIVNSYPRGPHGEMVDCDMPSNLCDNRFSDGGGGG
jgi:hypothetical protein